MFLGNWIRFTIRPHDLVSEKKLCGKGYGVGDGRALLLAVRRVTRTSLGRMTFEYGKAEVFNRVESLLQLIGID